MKSGALVSSPNLYPPWLKAFWATWTKWKCKFTGRNLENVVLGKVWGSPVSEARCISVSWGAGDGIFFQSWGWGWLKTSKEEGWGDFTLTFSRKSVYVWGGGWTGPLKEVLYYLTCLTSVMVGSSLVTGLCCRPEGAWKKWAGKWVQERTGRAGLLAPVSSKRLLRSSNNHLVPLN